MKRNVNLRGIRVFKSSLVDSFQVWGKVTRRSIEQALEATFGKYQEVERNVVFNRPGFYVDRVTKSAWYEIEVSPGLIRAFYADYDFHKWEWDNIFSHGDRIMNRAEYEEMKRVFRLYDVPRLSRPAIYLASREYWHKVDMTRDFNLSTLRYEKEHGTLAERIAKKRAKRLEKQDGTI